MATQLVMVGMQQWFDQDVQPLSELIMQCYGLPEACVERLQNPTKTEVTDTLAKAGKTKPETLIFYYSGHGAFKKDGDGFQFCTNAEAYEPWLEDFELTAALEGTGATKVSVVIDACHAGDCAVKHDIEGRFVTLSKGTGIVMIGACDAKLESTTPGSSPLTEAYKAILQESRLPSKVLDMQSIKERVKARRAAAIMNTSDGDQQFSGLIIQASCRNGACSQLSAAEFKLAGMGHFSITEDEKNSCDKCGSDLQAEVLHFVGSCHWQIRHSFLEPSRRVVRCDTGIKTSKADKSWTLAQIIGYRTLTVHAWRLSDLDRSSC